MSDSFCNPMDYTVHGILQARILEWVADTFSRGSSQPRDWTQVSCIAGRFFTSWATREAQECWSWGAFRFSRRSSQPRNWTGVSCIAGRFFTSWAERKSLLRLNQLYLSFLFKSGNAHRVFSTPTHPKLAEHCYPYMFYPFYPTLPMPWNFHLTRYSAIFCPPLRVLPPSPVLTETWLFLEVNASPTFFSVKTAYTQCTLWILGSRGSIWTIIASSFGVWSLFSWSLIKPLLLRGSCHLLYHP